MRGTVVEAEFKGVQYTKGIRGPFEYIRWTAAANPHAEIMFKDPEGSEMLFERVIDKVPKVPKAPELRRSSRLGGKQVNYKS